MRIEGKYSWASFQRNQPVAKVGWEIVEGGGTDNVGVIFIVLEKAAVFAKRFTEQISQRLIPWMQNEVSVQSLIVTISHLRQIGMGAKSGRRAKNNDVGIRSNGGDGCSQMLQ